ncbi:MAG: GTP-binding protein [Thermoplasmatales archaeon]
MQDVMQLISSARNGSRRDIGRLITIVENRGPGYNQILDAIKGRRDAFVVGVTGPPGVGKSTLISRLASRLSLEGRIAIIMIDASSPFSGGSLLGNRLRLEENENIYVRSMATRGSTGGLNFAIGDSLDLLSYLGFKTIMIESVGTGQDETDILYYSDLIAMVLSPGLGDEIQAIKAGQMEIGDFIVLNKADKPEAFVAEKELMEMISIPDLAKRHELFRVSCVTGEGIDALAEAIKHAIEMGRKEGNILEREKERMRRDMESLLRKNEKLLEDLAKRVVLGDISRDRAIKEFLNSLT